MYQLGYRDSGILADQIDGKDVIIIAHPECRKIGDVAFVRYLTGLGGPFDDVFWKNADEAVRRSFVEPS